MLAECVVLLALDGSAPFVSDAAECAVKTAPASTFKVPHALIALETEGEQTMFWLNGDLAISPVEQVDFISRLVRGVLPVERRHVDAVKAAFTMPPGAVTNATGTHPFDLKWPAPLVVRAKTGNATVAGERVSWVVGHVEAGNRGWVFAARVRGGSEIPGQAGADLALRTLNARSPK